MIENWEHFVIGAMTGVLIPVAVVEYKKPSIVLLVCGWLVLAAVELL